MCQTADLWCTARWEDVPSVEIPSCQPFAQTGAEGMNSWCKPIKYVCVLLGEKWSRESRDAKRATRSHHHRRYPCTDSRLCAGGLPFTRHLHLCFRAMSPAWWNKRQWRNNPLVCYSNYIKGSGCLSSLHTQTHTHVLPPLTSCTWHIYLHV